MDNVDLRRSDNHDTKDAEGVIEGDEERQALLDSVTKSEHMKSKCSLTSICSDFSSEDDFFQLDAASPSNPISSERNTLSAGLLKVLNATNPTSPTGPGAKVASEVDAKGDKAALDGNRSPETEAGDPDISSKFGLNQTSQCQEAEKIDGYDPNRIPASVFAATSLSPMEWSLASNESLFSIRMECCSFSRDHLMGRSGELGNFSYSPPRTDAADSPLTSSLDPEEVNLDDGNDLEQVDATEEVNARTMEDVLRSATGEYSGMYLPATGDIPSSASNPRQSDASSIQSFAFPILTGASLSLKVVPEQQPQWQKNPQVERIEPPPKPPHCRWFQCFSCSLCHAD